MAGIAGPVVFALLTSAFGSGRAGIAAVLLFFAVGLWLLSGVDSCTECHKQVKTGV
jgi:MFS-type transporter involved in bile tolerance (Atg22 family)